MPVLLEVDIELRVCKYAERLGILHLKLNVKGRRGYPDRIYFLPGGRPLLIEFKRPGTKPEPLQEFRHERLRIAGYRVAVCDSYAGGVAALDSSRLSTQGGEASA